MPLPLSFFSYAGTNGYANFTVDRGRVILGAPGQTNIIKAIAWVGSRTLTSPRLDIIGGVTRFTDTYFTIGRGTGTTASPQQPSLYISNNAHVEMHSFVMGYSNGQPGFYSEPYLNVDNASLVVLGDCYLSENENLLTRVAVTNNGLFQCDSTSTERGMSISQSSGASTHVNFGGNSTGRTYQLGIRQGGNLNVTQGSVFELDATPLNVANINNKGTARFNDGTLKQRTSRLASDWMVGLTDLRVGAGNMTIDVESHAWLDPILKEDPASVGGKIIKTGAGTLVMRPTALELQVNSGRVSLATESPNLPANMNGTISVASGGALELAAAGGAAAMELALNATTLTLSPHSLASNPDLWAFNGRAIRRADGVLQMTPESGKTGTYNNLRGSAFMLRKQAVSGPWSATFSYLCWSLDTNPADGAAFILHNDPRELTALGDSGSRLGYGTVTTSTAEKIINSVAVGIDSYGHRLRFGEQGDFVDDRALPASMPKIASMPVKTKFTVSYDGAGTLTVLMERPGFPAYNYSRTVDIAAKVGGSEAYFGFSGSTGGRYGQHCFTDVVFENGSTTPSYCRYGGGVALGTGETLAAKVAPSLQQQGFVLGKLSYADQAVIDVASEIADSAPPPATFADQGMWKLNGKSRWKDDGTLAVSSNAVNSSGWVYTTNSYPVTGSWNASFGFDLGLKSGTPADFISFVIQNDSPSNSSTGPNPGLAILWRYYDQGVTTTALQMYTNGVLVVASTDIAPVSLRTGGHAEMLVNYNALNRALTVITTQAAGASTNVFTDVDLLSAIRSTTAYIGFKAYVGGLFAENIVSNFSFVHDDLPSSNYGYLAFDELVGSGTLIKRGSAAMGLMGDAGRSTADLALQLEEGGLVLRKTASEPIATTGSRSEWVFTPEGKWGPDNTLQFCTTAINSRGTATSSRRVRVKEPWTISYSFLFGAKSNTPADAYSLFFHNDPRGPGVVGGQTGGAGYSGITKSIGLRWYFYPYNDTPLEDSTSIGRNGVWNENSLLSHVPISLVTGVTDFEVSYDPVAATLTSIMTQGATVITNRFNGVNIPADVGGDYAYVGFGGGCGGSYGEMRVRDFKMVYAQEPADGLAEQAYLANLVLPDNSENTVSLDTPLSESTFIITAAQVGDGATLSVAPASAQNGILAVENATLVGSATFDVLPGSALAISNVLSGVSITKRGGGTLYLPGSAATYSGDTVLEGGTLSLPAANLPVTTDLYVNGMANLGLMFTGKQHIHSLFVNGAAMPGGLYTAANTAWITGAGSLVVTYPPSGVLIIVR